VSFDQACLATVQPAVGPSGVHGPNVRVHGRWTRDSAPSRDTEAAQDRVNAIAVDRRGVERLEDEGSSSLPHDWAICAGFQGAGATGSGPRPERVVGQDGAYVAREVNTTHHHRRELSPLDHPKPDFQRPSTGSVLVRDGEARAAEVKFTGDAARDHAPQGALNARRVERRSQRLPQGCYPCSFCGRVELHPQLAGPGSCLRGQQPADVEARCLQVQADAHDAAG
jgi:hypothetical protein